MAGAGIQLKLEPFGFAAAEAAIRGIVLRGGNLKLPLEASGKFLQTRTQEHFEHEESPAGEPWAALSTRYVNAPKRGYYSGGRGGQAHPILSRSGRLEGSVNYRADATELAVGTNRKFKDGKSAAAIHQLGGKAGRGLAATIPARPFLGVSSGDGERIADFFVDYLGRL